jgi:starvation-inducible outer membrane lipoprotein
MKAQLTTLLIATLLLSACTTPPTSVHSGRTNSSRGETPYPLKVCIVTDNDLDSMGDEQTRVYEGQVVKFCCEPCVTKFESHKPKYLAKLTR